MSRQEYRGKQRAQFGKESTGFGNFKKNTYQEPPSNQGGSFKRGNDQSKPRGFKIYQPDQDEHDERPNRNFNKRESRYQEAPKEFNSYPENPEQSSSKSSNKGFERNFDGMNSEQTRLNDRGGRRGGYRGGGRGGGRGYNRGYNNKYGSRDNYNKDYNRGGDYNDVSH